MNDQDESLRLTLIKARDELKIILSDSEALYDSLEGQVS
jgi:hypothetical protein